MGYEMHMLHWVVTSSILEVMILTKIPKTNFCMDILVLRRDILATSNVSKKLNHRSIIGC